MLVGAHHAARLHSRSHRRYIQFCLMLAGAEAIMRKWLRRIRGALGMGFTWAAAWFAVGFVPRWLFGVQTDLPIPLLFGGLGFFAGVTFSGLLMLTEDRRRLDQLSLPRIAVWGAIGGV